MHCYVPYSLVTGATQHSDAGDANDISPLIATNPTAPSDHLHTALFSIEGLRGQDCVRKVEKHLLSTEGVVSATVKLLTQQLTVRYDPDKVRDVHQLLLEVSSLGYKLKLLREERGVVNRAVFKVVIHGMSCSSCVFVIERALKKCKGVTKASVTLSTNRQVYYLSTSVLVMIVLYGNLNSELSFVQLKPGFSNSGLF